MSAAGSDTSDVIVIGSGLGSLACAVDLARQGLAVRVFEQHVAPGGYAHAFKRRGLTFDVSLHQIGGFDPGGMVRTALESLGVLDRVVLLRNTALYEAERPWGSLTLPNDFEGVLEALCRLAPRERDGLRRLFDALRALKRDVYWPTFDPTFAVPLEERVSRPFFGRTFGQVISAYVSEPRVVDALGQLWQYVGLPPSRATATFATCVVCDSFLEGSYYIRGGGAALSRAFVERLRQLGGGCVTRARVARVLVEHGAAVGVELEGGERHLARRVVSGANPFTTFFDLLGPGDTSDVFRYRLEKMELSLSAYALYLGLDCPPGELGIPPHTFFGSGAASAEEAYRRALDHEIDGTDWCLSNYTAADPEAAPPGRAVLSAVEVTPARRWLELDPARYAAEKAEVKSRLLAKLERRFPGLGPHVEVAELATPRTMARYTSNRGGAIYGFAQTVEQSNSRRLRNRPPLPGLFLTGAWTWSGGGYAGAMMSGLQTAAAVLADLQAPRTAGFTLTRSPTSDEAAPPRAAGEAGGENLSSAREDDFPVAAVPGECQETGAPGRPERGGGEALPYRLRERVYGTDVGLRGVIDASSCLRFMDRGRVEAIEAQCATAGKESWLAKYMVNVYRLDARLEAPARLGDRLEVQTGIRQRSSHRVAFDQRLVHEPTGQTVAEATVEVLFVGREGALVTVPAELCDADPGAREPLVATSPGPLPGGRQAAFRRTYRVYYEDTDAQAIAYHVTYVRFCERALIDLLDEVVEPRGSPLAARLEGRSVRVARLTMRYLHAARLGDRLEVRIAVRPASPGSGLVTLDARLGAPDDAPAVSAEAQLEVAFSDAEGRPAAVPEALVAMGEP